MYLHLPECILLCGRPVPGYIVFLIDYGGVHQYSQIRHEFGDNLAELCLVVQLLHLYYCRYLLLVGLQATSRYSMTRKDLSPPYGNWSCSFWFCPCVVTLLAIHTTPDSPSSAVMCLFGNIQTHRLSQTADGGICICHKRFEK